ncbi:hypothetical protein RclHR1_00150024 [Rhizophagus clarus]|uniref:High mobility group box domain-containing protein n=1 Tax=Rhizophagus clarus TaxID=94130 RepID=A0A2Z6R6S5_9GLOM|nr:hypothetical protein RclHR1_00150024 [Rhizophagus clarus]GET02307.1 high mobility group box domain-containing protein [Rhizophagus clarus]
MSQSNTDEEIVDSKFDEEIVNLKSDEEEIVNLKSDEGIVNIKIDEEIFNLKIEEGIVNSKIEEEIVNSKTDEEIVNSTNYNFTLDIETLLNNSTTTRRAMRLQRKGELCYTPRPQNPFMLYRRDMSARSEFVGIKSSETSKQIGKMWKNETSEVKDLFNALARLAEKRHSEKYSDYSYSPKRKKKELQ